MIRSKPLNAPVPDVGQRDIYGFRKLKPGKAIEVIGAKPAKVMNAARQFAFHNNMKFKCRTLHNGNVGVWRLE